MQRLLSFRYADSTLIVDRVALRDGPKLVSIARIARLVQGVRRSHFDFVMIFIVSKKQIFSVFYQAHRKPLFTPPDSLTLISLPTSIRDHP